MSQGSVTTGSKRFSLSTRYAPKRMRTSGKRSARGYSVTRVPRGQGLPKMLSATLRYYNQFAVTTNGSGIGTAVFYANGMFQPQAGATTHQPHYFDQWMGLYDHFRIVSSKCTFTMLSPANTSTYTLAAFLDDDTTPSNSTYYDGMEREGAVFSDKTLLDSEVHKVSINYNAKTVFGLKATTDSQTGSDSANPTEASTFVCHVSGNGNSTYNLSVFITYDAVFTEQRSVVTS